MINVGVVGSTGRVGSLLIDDLETDNEAKLSACHVFDDLKKSLYQREQLLQMI